ncbi:hypothetical protein J6590_006158 [Homalodisca vitripennis]|nr:hypothetical protein J6590_006158 [Homalodisca vitripennis]
MTNGSAATASKKRVPERFSGLSGADLGRKESTDIFWKFNRRSYNWIKFENSNIPGCGLDSVYRIITLTRGFNLRRRLSGNTREFRGGIMLPGIKTHVVLSWKRSFELSLNVSFSFSPVVGEGASPEPAPMHLLEQAPPRALTSRQGCDNSAYEHEPTHGHGRGPGLAHPSPGCKRVLIEILRIPKT